jgi:hypothetical protein
LKGAKIMYLKPCWKLPTLTFWNRLYLGQQLNIATGLTESVWPLPIH